MHHIEVLNYILVTIKYNDVSEESLLYKLKIETNTLNEEIRITLASEEVENSNSEYDLTWEICQINGEYYISLSYAELRRLKVPLDRELDEVEYTSNDPYYSQYKTTCRLSELPYAYHKDDINLTVEKIWLTQKKNSFNEKDIKVDPSMCNYLFKLVEN